MEAADRDPSKQLSYIWLNLYTLTCKVKAEWQGWGQISVVPLWRHYRGRPTNALVFTLTLPIFARQPCS